MNKMAMVFLSLVLSMTLHLVSGHMLSQFYTKGNASTVCGRIENRHTKRILSCSSQCLQQKTCKGILFDESTNFSKRCKLVTSDSKMKLDFNEFYGYQDYSMKQNQTTACKNLGIGIPTPEHWKSGCPRVYFSLDSDVDGTSLGNNPSEITFLSPGKIGNSFAFMNPSGSYKAYYNLGTFPSPDYCFPVPDTCPQGFTIAYWLNFLGEHVGSSTQTFIGARPQHGPGFRV